MTVPYDTHTYLNENGLPILRRCHNCKNWKQIEDTKNGYCALLKMYFAFTLEESVYAVTKDFYLCREHRFRSEEWLDQTTQRISLRASLRPKSTN